MAHKQAMLELQEKIKERVGTLDNQFFKVANDYVAYQSKFIKANTKVKLTAAYNNLKKIWPEDILFSAITPARLQGVINDFYESHSYSHTRQLFGFISRVYKYGLRMGFINDINILFMIEIKKKPKTAEDVKREQDKYLDSGELAFVLSELKKLNANVAMMCEFQALTGLRYGEMIALRIRDYNKGVIDVNGSIQRIGSLKDTVNRVAPKNAYSVRKVILDERAQWIIEHFITASKAKVLWSPNVYKSDYIFTTANGLPMDYSYVNKLLKKVPIDKTLTTHTFRHTHISLLAEANVPLRAIMQRVGHSEPRTTLAVYTHVTQTMDAKVQSAIEDLAKKITP